MVARAPGRAQVRRNVDCTWWTSVEAQALRCALGHMGREEAQLSHGPSAPPLSLGPSGQPRELPAGSPTVQIRFQKATSSRKVQIRFQKATSSPSKSDFKKQRAPTRIQFQKAMILYADLPDFSQENGGPCHPGQKRLGDPGQKRLGGPHLASSLEWTFAQRAP